MKENKENNNKIIRIILIVIFSLGIISGVVYIGTSTYIKYKEKNMYDELAEFMKAENIDNEENKELKKSERIKKLEELHSQNEDIVGWIEIPDRPCQNMKSFTLIVTMICLILNSLYLYGFLDKIKNFKKNQKLYMFLKYV